MQKGIQKQRQRAQDEARRLLNELEANERDDYDELMKDDNDGPRTEETLDCIGASNVPLFVL